MLRLFYFEKQVGIKVSLIYLFTNNPLQVNVFSLWQSYRFQSTTMIWIWCHVVAVYWTRDLMTSINIGLTLWQSFKMRLQWVTSFSNTPIKNCAISFKTAFCESLKIIIFWAITTLWSTDGISDTGEGQVSHRPQWQKNYIIFFSDATLITQNGKRFGNSRIVGLNMTSAVLIKIKFMYFNSMLLNYKPYRLFIS